MSPRPTIPIWVDSISKCTHRCRMCPIDKLDRSGTISAEVADRVAALFRESPNERFHLFIHFVGEPLLHDDLEGLIKKFSLPNVEVWVSTNGLLLTPEKLDSLLAAGLRHLWFSMFSLDEKKYEEITGTKVFSKVMSNLGHLLSRSQEFKCLQIITFDEDGTNLCRLTEGRDNVFVQIGRPKFEWRYDRNPLGKKLMLLRQPLRGNHQICVTGDGRITLNWLDYDAERTIGNIMDLEPQEIVETYRKAGQMTRALKQFAKRTALAMGWKRKTG